MSDPIERLRAYLRNTKENVFPEESSDKPDLECAVDRFGMTYRDSMTLGPDEIVLLRQFVRWSGMQDIRVDRPSKQSEKIDIWFRKAGIDWSSTGYLSAEPYAPNWLQEKVAIMDHPPQQRTKYEDFPGEPYLRQYLDFENWLSPAQKEAAWTALDAPEGTTTTIVLPTGSGKSSCFWLLPAFTPGLTVVVVPTVALALDQYQSASVRYKNFPGVDPCYFAADTDPEIVTAKIKNKESRLIFASPETCVAGRLRPILDSLAKDGWFQNMVVDEAHLIETWGAQFRVEFQILAAARKRWLKDSGNRLRTFLFSATMSPQCRKTLSEMFAENDSSREFSCQRIRPEISYYGRWFKDSEERWSHLLEAIWRLPRPAILYVTKPSDAKELHDRLKGEEGFQRIGCFTGETKRGERKSLLDDWKHDRIDLMVGTSAFGVGIDKSNVRTVIHACYPENLDRYYQEVGRSGRDGYASVSLFMPTYADRIMAKGLGIKMLRDKETIQERWEAMYNSSKRVEEEEYVFEFPMSVKRLNLHGNRTYSQNIIWNKSLLLQLYRAKCIDLRDLCFRPPENPEDEIEEWATVEVKFPPGDPNIADRLATRRQEELEYFDIGFSDLEKLLTGKVCVSRILQKLYRIPEDQRVCGGCHHCRANKREPGECPTLRIPENPSVTDRVKGSIVENWPNPIQVHERDDFIGAFEKCLHKYSLKPLQLYCPQENFEEILNSLKEEGVLGEYHDLYRIDPFTDDTILWSRSNRSPLFLHIGSYSEIMFEAARAYSSIHLFCDIQHPYEANGRHIKIKYGCESWQSPEAWLSQLN